MLEDWVGVGGCKIPNLDVARCVGGSHDGPGSGFARTGHVAGMSGVDLGLRWILGMVRGRGK